MKTAAFAAAALLLALAPAAVLADDGAPTSVRYLLPGQHSSSFIQETVTLCLDLERGTPSASAGSTCILAAPAASSITINVTQDPGLRALFTWAGVDANGDACGSSGQGFAEETVAWDPACPLVAVGVGANGYSGTIRVS